MVVNLTNTKQLDIFDTLKSVLKSNSILSRKFRDSDFYEYEPNIQSLSFKQLPYIAMVSVFNETLSATTNRQTRVKKFTTNFVLVMDYQARDKFRKYSDSIIQQIESSQSSFEAQGYYDLDINFIDRTIEYVNNKQVITGNFELIYNAHVDRL